MQNKKSREEEIKKVHPRSFYYQSAFKEAQVTSKRLEQEELNRKQEKIIVTEEPILKEFQKEFYQALDNDVNTYYTTDYRDIKNNK